MGRQSPSNFRLVVVLAIVATDIESSRRNIEEGLKLFFCPVIGLEAKLNINKCVLGDIQHQDVLGIIMCWEGGSGVK